MAGANFGRRLHPALFLLYVFRNRPHVFLEASRLRNELRGIGVSVSRVMVDRYRRYLLDNGYIEFIRGEEGWEAELTAKGWEFVNAVKNLEMGIKLPIQFTHIEDPPKKVEGEDVVKELQKAAERLSIEMEEAIRNLNKSLSGLQRLTARE